ncbi:MAG: LysR family transcriptional regulator [Myxococcaceae bacterium]|nr:LysR family transcriptional regulator [Myxococcaceae bacterium]
MRANPSWDDLRLILAVGRSGSFLKASVAHRLATSTFSRRMTQLERDLGVALLERRNDGVRLTPAGQRLFATAEDVELRLESGMRDLGSNDEARLEGAVRITCGDGFAPAVVDAVAGFALRHPKVQVELVVDSRMLDLPRREADIAIRTRRGSERSLIYQGLGQLALGLWASAGYLERAGQPRSAAQLAKHTFISMGDDQPLARWMRAQGARDFVFQCTTFSAVVGAVRAGMGISVLPHAVADGFTRVLPSLEPPEQEVYLVMHEDARRQAPVRVFAGWLKEQLGRVLRESPR